MLIYYFRISATVILPLTCLYAFTPFSHFRVRLLVLYPNNSKNLPVNTQGASNVEYEKMYFDVTRTYYSTVTFTDVPIEPLPWIPKSVEAPGVRVEFQLIGVIT